MTDRVVRLDLEKIVKAREATTVLRDAAREGRVIDFRKRDPLVIAIHLALDQAEERIAEVERLRSALLHQQDLEPIQKLVMEWQRRASARDNDPNAGTALRAGAQHLRWCADELHRALLLCEAQGRRHEETKEKIDTRYESPVTPPSTRATASTD